VQIRAERQKVPLATQRFVCRFANFSRDQDVGARPCSTKELQVVLRYQEAVEDVVAAPLEVERFSGKRAVAIDPCESDLDDLTDRAFQLGRQDVHVSRLEASAPGVRANRQ
jgi:hypothetical protein